ncbi:MAG: type I-E CRISPR-associated protein Cas5/CasD [Clostridiales bacterium]|jgi:CRISPR system Cascade subunit CasD|nr:type I-E CRISPR-associated protein Cas5/CasD [Clostridiales bacterium]
MSTLLLRLAAPIQAWGVDKFERRGTERIPTKSGVIGLLAAALGRRRNESIEDLSELCFGVRVDREGTLLRDFHTAKSQKSAYVTYRYYLSDAVFLVGLEGDEILLNQIDYALHHPVFPLYLGRRSCPPEGKLSLGIRKGKTLIQALKEEPWQVSDRIKKTEDPEVRLRVILDADGDSANWFIQRDFPLSFDQSNRQYGFRRVIEADPVLVFNSHSRQAITDVPTKHDPMQELGEG